jgi:hypothetical protein
MYFTKNPRPLPNKSRNPAWAVLQCVKIFVRRFLGFQNPCSIIQGFGDFLRNFPRILKDILARFSGFWCISVGITRDFDQNFWLKFMGSFRSKKQSPRQNLKQLEVDESRWSFLRWNASENSLAFWRISKHNRRHSARLKLPWQVYINVWPLLECQDLLILFISVHIKLI